MQSSLVRLKTIFSEMSDNGFDTSEPLKWGFFFFDREKGKLSKVLDVLKKSGYNQEGLNLMDDGEWRLFVSKIDTLTPEKLYRRNIAFNQLAKACEVSLYDGWDVERL